MQAKKDSIFLIKSWNSSFIPGAKNPGRKLGKGHYVMTVLRGLGSWPMKNFLLGFLKKHDAV